MSLPETQTEEKPSGQPVAQARRRPTSTLFLVLVAALVILMIWSTSGGESSVEITYGQFREELKKGNVLDPVVQGDRVSGKFRVPISEEAAPPSAPASHAADTKAPQGSTATPAERAAERSPAAEAPSAAASSGNAPHHVAAKPGEPAGAWERTKKPARERFVTVLPAPIVVDSDLDRELRAAAKGNYVAKQPNDGTTAFMLLYLLVTIGLFVALWYMFRRARDQVFGGGGVLAGFARSPARRYTSSDRPVTFADVAGLEGVKLDLQEVVEFLKNPKKFQRLGGRVPKGILLMGPPGTGKTLLGRAVAGEAGVPFFSINGSEFIQMFVGVGASRVRDMFATAKENAPCILFIDEIDAVGRHRGAGLGGGHDEREQTLNQILSEMDGFTQTETVIVMAATNRPDVLDPALLRPGRFDRHIVVDRPSLKGRLEIFKVHTREVPLAPDVNLERLAAGTVGLTGADIRNLVNEAALWASRQDKQHVEMSDFEYARDKVLMGSKREEVLTAKERAMTAYHEAGHALTAWLTPGIDRVHKVSIIPRGRALGVTQLLPDEDRFNVAETELHSRLLFILGGRAAEKLVFSEYTAGAENDLKQATMLARRMVTRWGMSERVGPVAFRDSEEHPFLGREIAEERQYSEHTAQVIDEEVARILRRASDGAMEILANHRDKLNALADGLQREETLDESQIEALLGPPAYRQNGEAREEAVPAIVIQPGDEPAAPANPN